ncbi:MAG: Gfo/Idh/MocA family oxidoreductase [Clostridia bacterium]|nr:Gfo/Idh/MocA family oxidoreductase [Clostridia bacterium]
MRQLSVLLVGVGGYGTNYAREMLDHGEALGAVLAGVVDPYAATSKCYGELTQRGARFFNTVNEFYLYNTADLAVISTPIQFHADQAVTCLEHGSHVLCEKPAAATVEDVQLMIAARDRAGKALAIGFQWCYDPAMLRLKADVDAGLLGKPLAMKSLVLWPRAISYYKRGLGWAGKKYDASGAAIFDSVASNATAHYIENMLWLAGRDYAGADVRDMRVQTLRANDIETFDTVVMDAVLENGAKLFFAASHAVGAGGIQEPVFEYEFENAVVRYGALGAAGNALRAEWRDGTVKDYGVSSTGGCDHKLRTAIALARGENAALPCPVEAALRHTRAMAMIFEKQPEAERFPAEAVRLDDGMVWVPGLKDRLVRCYENWEML